MSQTDHYFQFPLAMLNGAVSSSELIQQACIWTLANLGESLAPNVVQILADEYQNAHPSVVVAGDEASMTMAAAAVRLGVNMPDINASCRGVQKLRKRFGIGGKQVRLRVDIAWDAHDKPWPLPKLSVLCAVYAAIGNRDAQKISHRTLRAYSAGSYSLSDSAENAWMAKSTLRYWLEQLWLADLFQLCTDGNDRWYSNRCKDDKELAKLVKKIRKFGTPKSKIATDDV